MDAATLLARSGVAISNKPAPCQETCQAFSLQPIQVRHPHVYDQSAICKRKAGTLITIITELRRTVKKKNEVQHEITSI